MSALNEELTREPRRRVVMIAKISADSWRELQGQLQHLATEIARREKLSTFSVSGGYSSGHVVVTSEDGAVTHDSWAAKLDEYLEELAARESVGSTAAVPGKLLADGCCSAVSPCSHQQKSPSTICAVCQQASALTGKDGATS